MLPKWISEAQRIQSLHSFPVIDITEHTTITDEIKSYLSKHLLLCFRDPNFLIRKYKDEPADELKNYLQNSVFPSGLDQPSKNTIQGDWGEAITSLILKDFRGLLVPVSKMRWKINNDKSMFGTDVFAIEQDDNEEITKLIYCETKTYRSKNKNIAEVAYHSLYRDNGGSLPDIIDFIERVYFERKDYEMADKFSKVYKNMDKYNKEFQIFLIFEKSSWDDVALDNLHNLPPSLQNLHINVFLIDNLKELVDDTYKQILKVGEEIVYGDRTVSNE